MLSTLKFVLFTVISLLLVFTAVYVTILNTYKPVVRTYINGKFVGYFSDEQQFDEIYNDLVTEKQSIDENVKVYLESEPTFEKSYIKDSLLRQQNVYTNLRAEIKTEFTIYKVVVAGEEQMTFTAQDQADEYIQKIKAEVSDIDTSVDVQKVSELENVTSLDRANVILDDIIARNKPVELPPEPEPEPVAVYTPAYGMGAVVPTLMGNLAWPTVSREVNCDYWGYWGHNGVDLRASVGTPVYAFMDGTVEFAGWDSSGYGECVKINHGNGMKTIYAHNSVLHVTVGQQVTAGQLIASSGNTGNTTGPHVHFEVKMNGVSVNPWNVLNQIP